MFVPVCLIAFLLSGALSASADISRDFNTGVYLYKKGDYELAAKTFEIILTKFPGDARTDEVMYWYGESNYHLGKFADALGIYKKLAAEYPTSKFTGKAVFSAGFAAMKMGLYRDAVAFFRDVEKDPATDRDIAIESRIVIADCFLKMGDDKQAEQALRDLLATPKLPAARRQETEFELGQLLIRVGRAAEGRAAFTRVAEKPGPHQGEALMALGDASYSEGRYRESLEWYEKIFRKVRGVTPEFRARAVYNGAWSYLGLGDVEKARALFTEVYEDKSAPPEVRGDAALRLAYLYREKNNLKGSDDMALAAMDIAESGKQQRLKDDVLIFRAESAFFQKKFDESLAHLSRVSEKGYRVLRLTGQIFFESGRPADAALYFERAAMAAGRRDALNLCLFDMAQSHFAAGSYDSAVTAVNRIKDPDAELNARIKPFMASALQNSGKFKEAARLYERLADETADTAKAQSYRYFSALAYVQAKFFTQASSALEVFFQIASLSGGPSGGMSGDSVAAAALILNGDIKTSRGKFEEAEVEYLRAIPAARSVGSDNLFLAYSHLVDFALKHAVDRLVDHTDAFIAALNDTRAYAFVIDRLYDGGQHKHLLKYTDDILKNFPTSADVYGKAAYYQMMAHYKREELAASERSHDALVKWVAAHPNSEIAEEANFWRARFAQARGNRAQSKSAYLSYLDFHPTGKYVSDAHFNIALMALEDGQPAEAEAALMVLIAGKSQDAVLADPLLADAQYNLASVRILQGRFDDAAAILEPLASHKTFKSDPAYLYKLGYVKVSQGRLAEAESHFRDVLSKPKVPAATMDNTITALFSLLYRAERYGELETDFKRYSERIKDRALAAKAKFLMGMTMFDAERFTDAIPFFKAVKAPADTELVIESTIRLADCDYNLKRYKTALDRYARVADEFSATRWGREALYASGLCKIKLGFPEGALTGFERFLQQNPDEPLARDVAMEAARLYLLRGDLDAAEQKIEFLEKRKVEGAFLEETMRMRIRIWQARGDADKVLTLAKSHRGAYGANPEIAITAAEAAINLGRPQDAIDALEGFAGKMLDTTVQAHMDFYRAEAMHKLGREGAMDLYKRLADFPDTEIRLSSRFRYGQFLMEEKQFDESREMFASILASPAGRRMPFYQESIENAFSAAKLSGSPAEMTRLYDKFAPQILDEKNKITAAEFNLWARLALKDHAKSQAAIDDLLALNLDQRRRTEIRLTSAQIHETTKNFSQADAIYSGILNNPNIDPDLRGAAEARKVQMAISRGSAGRPILEEYLMQGPQGEWAQRASASLLSAAVQEKRHLDVIRTVDLIENKLAGVGPAARYAAAIARLSLSDTAGALSDFRKVVSSPSPETFYVAWSAYRLAQDELSQSRSREAKPFLKMAWAGRANLDSAACLNTYQQYAEILFEGSDYEGMQTLANDPPPAGGPSEPHLLKGLGAWWAKDYATASRHLKEVVHISDQIRMLYAQSLAASGDALAAIPVYEQLAEGQGDMAGRAQLSAAELLETLGRTAEGLIGYYKVLAVYESDTTTELAAEALFRISKAYEKTGDTEKSKNASADLLNKYPDSRAAKERAAGR